MLVQNFTQTEVVEWDEVNEEYVAITRVSDGRKVWDLPTEWADPTVAYVECQSEAFLDRSNDEYEPDWNVALDYSGDVAVSASDVYTWAPVVKSYTDTPGYDLVGVKHVRCWYCDSEFKASDVAMQSGAGDEVDFVREMLVHYSECREANGGIPYVRTYVTIPRTIYRPDGSVAAHNPGRVTKPWRIKGALLGGYVKK